MGVRKAMGNRGLFANDAEPTSREDEDFEVKSWEKDLRDLRDDIWTEGRKGAVKRLPEIRGLVPVTV